MIAFEATKTVRADHPAFADHFPGNPMLPGAVLAELVVETAQDAGWSVVAIDSLKFAKPIRGGGRLRIVFRRNGPTAQFDCSMADTVVASGTLRLAQ